TRTAQVCKGSQILAQLTYGHAAEIWRINLGWKRRQPNEIGFFLDTERGFWKKRPEDEEGESEEDRDPLSPRLERVIPFVNDRRNCLLFELGAPSEDQDEDEQETNARLASLQAALKSAIQVVYQVEDGEIAAEPLPSRQRRRSILLYEAAEGGAGVLRQLVDAPGELARVARQALENCHFDPATGEDRRRAPRAKEDCEAACYQCLLSYTNQPDHPILDRLKVREVLQELAAATVACSPTEETREERLARLQKLAGSGLERSFLDLLQKRKHTLPDTAQAVLEGYQARPDFAYHRGNALVFIDGPPHDAPEVRRKDTEQTQALEDAGYLVLRFRHDEDWSARLDEHPSVFGRAEEEPQRPRSSAAPTANAREKSFDPELFDAAWHPLLELLVADPAFTVEPGKDVADGRGVLGSTFAHVSRGELGLALLDVATPGAAAVSSELARHGTISLALSKSDAPPAALARIRSHLV
ncbi:MAG: DUF1998 domain-containing protein, partial [Planctomycetes bacterium]|nr:DUF1998 domain-containing protein [Planctomycetota bacterium]